MVSSTKRTAEEQHIPANGSSVSPTKRARMHDDHLEARQTKARKTAIPSQPLGNLFFESNAHNARNTGLGNLAVLSDELLSGIFSELAFPDSVRIQAVSHAFYAFSRIEGHWKLEYIKRSRGGLQDWAGSWRSTYLEQFVKPPQERIAGLPTDSIRISDIYSDVLYLPHLAAKYDANKITSSTACANNILRQDGKALSASDLSNTPMIITGAMDNWKAMSPKSPWSLPALANRYPTTSFRAEAVLTNMADYTSYHDSCEADESPLYIFDADFVEKTEAEAGRGKGLGADFEVPEVFQDDLFKVMGIERPNHRWLIAGPERSGSTFHCDPNGTSAWNAVVTGRKLWILFPPDVIPPGIMVSQDQSEVEAPLSLAEWLMNYYPQAKALYGSKAKDPSCKSKMLEGVCETGEIFYVPSGWWHLVVNLESSIAVTQNFVSPSNLPTVLYFLKHRADQVSGFKLRSSRAAGAEQQEYQGEEEDETGGGLVFARFCELLGKEYPDTLMSGMKGLARLEMEAEHKMHGSKKGKDTDETLWGSLTGKDKMAEEGEHAQQGGFSFGFDLDEELDEGV